MRKRSELRIIAELLQESKEESTRTRIMHRTNLNQGSFSKYLNLLLERGFLERIPTQSHQKYKITEKGIFLLQKIDEVQEMLWGKKSLHK